MVTYITSNQGVVESQYAVQWLPTPDVQGSKHIFYKRTMRQKATRFGES